MAEGKTIAAAAAAAGMSERSAYAWKAGALPGETKEGRTWRTRPDPFALVWDVEIIPLLRADTDGVLEAKTILAELQRRHGTAYGPGQLRTLQRRVHEWRAHHGPGKEVMFEQRHEPGREGAFDFTDCNELGVTIAGQAFVHLLFQFVLSFSKWRWVGLAFSETFEALVHGLQDALAAIGGGPQVWRSDNLSAATHQIPGGGRELNQRFAAVLDVVGTVDHPQSRVSDFYRELGDIFGVPFPPHNRWAGFKTLRARWGEHIATTLMRPVLVVDEAQEMLATVFGELRVLSSKELRLQVAALHRARRRRTFVRATAHSRIASARKPHPPSAPPRTGVA